VNEAIELITLLCNDNVAREKIISGLSNCGYYTKVIVDSDMLGNCNFYVQFQYKEVYIKDEENK